MFDISYNFDELIKANEVIIVVGEDIDEYYEPSDVVTIADKLTADVVTVGDADKIFSDCNTTPSYFAPFDDHLDKITNADRYLVVGVGFEDAEQVQWRIFGRDGIIITRHSSEVYKSGTQASLPRCKHWITNAGGDTLNEIASEISRVTSFSEPATVYSYEGDYPDPATTHLGVHEKGTEVKRCQVCHTLTNKRISKGDSYPGPLIEWQCPATGHRNHDRLEKLLKERRQLRTYLYPHNETADGEKRDRSEFNKDENLGIILRDYQRNGYDETTDEGQYAIKQIKSKRRELATQIEKLREWFDGRFDDVVSQNFEKIKENEVETFDPRTNRL